MKEAKKHVKKLFQSLNHYKQVKKWFYISTLNIEPSTNKMFLIAERRRWKTTSTLPILFYTKVRNIQWRWCITEHITTKQC